MWGQDISESHLTSFKHWGAEPGPFPSNYMNLHLSVSCHTSHRHTVLCPHLSFFAARKDQNWLLKSIRIQKNFGSTSWFQKSHFCKWSSFSLSLLFNPKVIPLQQKSDHKHKQSSGVEGGETTFAVCMLFIWQSSVKQALWWKSSLTNILFVCFSACIQPVFYHPRRHWLDVFVVTNQEWWELPQIRSKSNKKKKKRLRLKRECFFVIKPKDLSGSLTSVQALRDSIKALA